MQLYELIQTMPVWIVWMQLQLINIFVLHVNTVHTAYQLRFQILGSTYIENLKRPETA